jgi:uncharacterized coiled-coil protein SlyX
MNPLEIRMAHLEGAYEQVNLRLASMDGRLDSLDRRMDSLDRRMDSLGRKVDQFFTALDGKIDSRFMWTIGVVLASWLTTSLGIAGLFLRR